MANSEYQELKRFLDEKFVLMDSRLENMATKQEVTRQFEETKRYIGVLSEDLRHKIDLVVEGHQLLNQKIDNLSQETKDGIRETQAMIKFSYTELDQRIRVLENELLLLRTRIERLEARQN